jgi:hypothetical protein
MVGMTAASILALTAGVMLWYSYLGWHRMQEAAEMQRSSSLAMNTMASAIRGGWTNTDLWSPSTSELKISNTNKPVFRFKKIDNRLVYTVNNGASMDMVTNGVSVFTCSAVINHRVQVVLSITNALMNISMTNTIYGRK